MKPRELESHINPLPLTSFSEGRPDSALGSSPGKGRANYAQPQLVLVRSSDLLRPSASNTASGDLDQRLVSQGNPALEQLASISSLLMLQGPIGPLFSRIAAWKRGMGHQVRRVIFNAGDAGYCDDKDAIYYRNGQHEWRDQLHSCVREHDVKGVLLFGQTRFYHRQAIEICQSMGIPVFVMEEGYVRPGFLTLEMIGVNAYSTTLKNHVWSAETAAHELRPATTRADRFKVTLCAINYYLRLKAGSWLYPNYVHHRDTTLWRYAKYWVSAALVYPYTRWQDKKSIGSAG